MGGSIISLIAWWLSCLQDYVVFLRIKNGTNALFRRKWCILFDKSVWSLFAASFRALFICVHYFLSLFPFFWVEWGILAIFLQFLGTSWLRDQNGCNLCLPVVLVFIFYFCNVALSNWEQCNLTRIPNLHSFGLYSLQRLEKYIRNMELADRAVGALLSVISLSVFTYYTFWVIILVSHFYLEESFFFFWASWSIHFSFSLWDVSSVLSAICGQRSFCA